MSPYGGAQPPQSRTPAAARPSQRPRPRSAARCRPRRAGPGSAVLTAQAQAAGPGALPAAAAARAWFQTWHSAERRPRAAAARGAQVTARTVLTAARGGEEDEGCGESWHRYRDRRGAAAAGRCRAGLGELKAVFSELPAGECCRNKERGVQPCAGLSPCGGTRGKGCLLSGGCSVPWGGVAPLSRRIPPRRLCRNAELIAVCRVAESTASRF